MSSHQPADPVADGIIPCAKQSFSDFFRWKQRVTFTDEYGNSITEWQSPPPLRNPISLVSQLKARDWLFFLGGLSAWTVDYFDYSALSIQTVKLASYYDVSNSSITTAITLTLLLRSVGAALFGLVGDQFGRKWPMVINLWILGLLQIATVYAGTFSQFLAVRSLFGIFMGGIYGNAMAMALENCPVDARGLMSGFLQQGSSIGYILAACANLGVGGSPASFKTIFWIAAGASFGAGFVRMLFPESRQFVEAKKAGKTGRRATEFWGETRAMLRMNWKMTIYCIILMTYHTGSDSYTSFMLQGKGLDNSAASRASIVMRTGAFFGGITIGYVSQFVGRRRAIVVSAFIGALLIPAWILPQGERSLSVGAFFFQFFVLGGSWGVIPIHLNELSPAAYRSFFPGFTYQVGNMISSPATQIVNVIAGSNFIAGPSGSRVPAYGPTMGIATAIIAVGIICTTIIGPEKRGRHFGDAPAAGVGIADAGDIERVPDGCEYNLLTTCRVFGWVAIEGRL